MVLSWSLIWCYILISNSERFVVSILFLFSESFRRLAPSSDLNTIHYNNYNNSRLHENDNDKPVTVQGGWRVRIQYILRQTSWTMISTINNYNTQTSGAVVVKRWVLVPQSAHPYYYSLDGAALFLELPWSSFQGDARDDDATLRRGWMEDVLECASLCGV